MVNIDKIKALAKEKGIKLNYITQQLGISHTFFADAAKGKVKISDNRLITIAEILNTTPEYLKDETDIKEKAPATPEGEGGDIAGDLTHYMEILESQESLMFDGEPLDDESKELLLISLKNTMELAKKMKERKKSGLSDNK